MSEEEPRKREAVAAKAALSKKKPPKRPKKAKEDTEIDIDLEEKFLTYGAVEPAFALSPASTGKKPPTGADALTGAESSARSAGWANLKAPPEADMNAPPEADMNALDQPFSFVGSGGWPDGAFGRSLPYASMSKSLQKTYNQLKKKPDSKTFAPRYRKNMWLEEHDDMIGRVNNAPVSNKQSKDELLALLLASKNNREWMKPLQNIDESAAMAKKRREYESCTAKSDASKKSESLKQYNVALAERMHVLAKEGLDISSSSSMSIVLKMKRSIDAHKTKTAAGRVAKSRKEAKDTHTAAVQKLQKLELEVDLNDSNQAQKLDEAKKLEETLRAKTTAGKRKEAKAAHTAAVQERQKLELEVDLNDPSQVQKVDEARKLEEMLHAKTHAGQMTKSRKEAKAAHTAAVQERQKLELEVDLNDPSQAQKLDEVRKLEETLHAKTEAGRAAKSGLRAGRAEQRLTKQLHIEGVGELLSKMSVKLVKAGPPTAKDKERQSVLRCRYQQANPKMS